MSGDRAMMAWSPVRPALPALPGGATAAQAGGPLLRGAYRATMPGTADIGTASERVGGDEA
jgi:hypothetical protein